MKYITKEFITDMINFMETNNIKTIKFFGCVLFCNSNKDYINESNTPYKYALHYHNMIASPPEPSKVSIHDWYERTNRIITADNKEQFFKNLLISKIYGKIIYDNIDEIKQILNNNNNNNIL